jgi:hypothetical protein
LETLSDELRILCAIRVMKMRPIAGFIMLWLKTRLHAGSGQPWDGSPSAVAQFAAAAPRRRFMTMAIATGGRNVLQACRNVGVQVCLSAE